MAINAILFDAHDTLGEVDDRCGVRSHCGVAPRIGEAMSLPTVHGRYGRDASFVPSSGASNRSPTLIARALRACGRVSSS